MISMPNVVDIYGVKFTVNYKIMDCKGETFLDKRVIYINPDYDLLVQKATLWHEILHQVIDERYYYHIDAMKNTTERDVLEHLAIGMVDWATLEILKTNPDLKRWLLDE